MQGSTDGPKPMQHSTAGYQGQRVQHTGDLRPLAQLEGAQSCWRRCPASMQGDGHAIWPDNVHTLKWCLDGAGPSPALSAAWAANQWGTQIICL